MAPRSPGISAGMPIVSMRAMSSSAASSMSIRLPSTSIWRERLASTHMARSSSARPRSSSIVISGRGLAFSIAVSTLGLSAAYMAGSLRLTVSM